MLRLLQWIFLGHAHKWKTIKEIASLRTKPGHPDVIVAKGSAYIQQCEHCGKLHEFDTLSKVDWYL